MDMNAKCQGGNLVSKFCFGQNCQSNSIMCNNEDCECYQCHKGCFLFLLLSNFVGAFRAKGSNKSQMYEKVLNWYQKIIKTLTISMEEVRNYINEAEFVVVGGVNPYKLLKEGGDTIKSSCMWNAVSILSGNVPVDSEPPLLFIDKQLEIYTQSLESLNKNLMEIMSVVRTNSFKFRFEQTLCKNFLIEDDNRIRKIQSPKIQNPIFGSLGSMQSFGSVQRNTSQIFSLFGGSGVTRVDSERSDFGEALLSPSLEGSEKKSIRVTFRVRNISQGDAYIGVCYKDRRDPATQQIPLTDILCRAASNQRGSSEESARKRYFTSTPSSNPNKGLFSNSSFMSNPNVNEYTPKQSTFKFENNDLLEVFFDKANLIVQITNRTKNLKQTIPVVLQKGNELHLCVASCTANTEFEYLGEVYDT